MLTAQRRIVTACAIAMAMLVGVGHLQAAPIVLDFEELAGMTYFADNPIPLGSRLSDAYLSTYGVRFTSGSEFVAVVEAGIGHATSGKNAIGGSRPGPEPVLLTYNRAFSVVASFFDIAHPMVSAVTDFVSLRGDWQGSSQEITLNAYDIHGALIDSFTTWDSGGATLAISRPGIHRVEFLGSASDSWGVAVDDFTFNAVTPIPEPASVAIWSVVGGLGAAGAWWRRKRKAG